MITIIVMNKIICKREGALSLIDFQIILIVGLLAKKINKKREIK